jgi:hypothetical protein
LASTGDVKYRPAIAKLLQHPNSEIRASATEQLDLLDRYINMAAGRQAFSAGCSETEAIEQATRAVPQLDASCVILGYYVKNSEMRNRDGPAWQAYREALKRLGLPDTFTRSATSA